MEYVEVMKIREKYFKSMGGTGVYCGGVNCEECMFFDKKTEDCTRNEDYKKVEQMLIDWNNKNPVKTNKEVFLDSVKEKFGEEFVSELIKFEGCKHIKCSGRQCRVCKFKDFWGKEYVQVKK